MYNLAHAYIYDYKDEKLINESIKLLIKSSKKRFIPSTELLCLIILQNIFQKSKNENGKISIGYVKEKISKLVKKASKLKSSLINIIQEQQLLNHSIFENYYKKYEEIEFIYYFINHSIRIKKFYNEESKLKFEDSNNEHNITADFYEGFGNDINQEQ